jgi:hypothetical protein
MRSDGLLVDKQSGNTAQVALAETSVSFSTILRLGPEALANVKQVSVIVSTPPNGTRSYNTYAISGIKYFSNTSFVLRSCTDDIYGQQHAPSTTGNGDVYPRCMG